MDILNILDAEDIIIFVVLLISTSLYFYFKRQNQGQVSQSYNNNKNKDSDEILIIEEKKEIKKVIILYGSQSGTAEDLAIRLGQDFQKAGCSAKVVDPDSFDLEILLKLPKNVLVIFILSTFGDGEPPENAIGLSEFFSRPDKNLSNLSYVVFGLGDSSYHHYNAFAKNIDNICLSNGGTCIVPLYLADANNNLTLIDEQYETWLLASWGAFCKFLHIFKTPTPFSCLGISTNNGSNECVSNDYKIIFHSSDDPELLVASASLQGDIGGVSRGAPYSLKNPFKARVLNLTQAFGKLSLRKCVHIELGIEKSGFDYNPGDHLVVWPQNSPSQVAKLAKAMLISEEDLDHVVFSIIPAANIRKLPPFPSPTTLRSAFTNYLDITRPIKKHIFRMWIDEIDKTKNEKAYLFYSSLVSSKEEYDKYVTGPYSSAAELLENYPIHSLTILTLLTSFQRIQPRYYSVSSSPRAVGSNIVHFTAVVVSFNSPDGSKVVNGLCTSYLDSLNVTKNELLTVGLRRSNFKLPRNVLGTPIIMIGPGTGVAPFRGFVQERADRIHKARHENIKITQSKALLFYGSRCQYNEYLFKEEWQVHLKLGSLSELYTAFSRNSSTKEHVQHRLLENEFKIWTLLTTEGAHVYVCGDGNKMAREVEAFFTNIAEKFGSMKIENAKLWVDDLRARGRYLEDVWAH